MTRVLVVGGTGLAGRAVAAEAVGRGLEVVALSRRVPRRDSEAFVPGVQYVEGDLVTGTGLGVALSEVHVVINAANGPTRATREVLTTGSRQLIAAAQRRRVRRIVLLSIINVDLGPWSYYQAKTEQERIHLAGRVESMVLRTTQFHEFVSHLYASCARFGVLPAPRGVRLQSIGVADAARCLMDAAVGPSPAHDSLDAAIPTPVSTVVGPEVLTAQRAAELWRDAHRSTALLTPIPLPRRLRAFLRAGHNVASVLPGDLTRVGGAQTFAESLRP